MMREYRMIAPHRLRGELCVKVRANRSTLTALMLRQAGYGEPWLGSSAALV
jgi:hypothetical protein